MPSKTQLFVHHQIQFHPHLEVNQITVRYFLLVVCHHQLKILFYQMYLSITTAPPIIAKIAKTPTTIRIFFLFPSLDFFSIISSVFYHEFLLQSLLLLEVFLCRYHNQDKIWNLQELIFHISNSRYALIL